jgi:D-aminopeptidase
MKREDVYKLIDGERDYQDSRWNDSSETRSGKPDILDKDKSLAEWLNYIEFHLGEAKHAVYALEPKKVRESIRKIAALAVVCMEYYDCPPRKKMQGKNIFMKETEKEIISIR